MTTGASGHWRSTCRSRWPLILAEPCSTCWPSAAWRSRGCRAIESGPDAGRRPGCRQGPCMLSISGPLFRFSIDETKSLRCVTLGTSANTDAVFRKQFSPILRSSKRCGTPEMTFGSTHCNTDVHIHSSLPGSLRYTSLIAWRMITSRRQIRSVSRMQPIDWQVQNRPF
jgi:hypothetical protein